MYEELPGFLQPGIIEDNKHKKMVRFGFEKLADFFNTKKKRR